MKNMLRALCGILALICCLNASTAGVIPIVATPTYTIAGTPAVVTGHSHQVVARNYNRVYVPTSYVPTGYVPATATYPVINYPNYVASTYATTYPSVYGAGYPYGYYGYYNTYPSYAYATVWRK